MLEAEVKLALDGPRAARLRDRITELSVGGATLHNQSDVYFQHPSRDLQARDEALRLRIDEGIYITWKGPKIDPPRKTREEIEFPLATDLPTATRLLEALGFTQVATVTKRREQWHLQRPHPGLLCIDEIPGLGTFAEVEVAAKSAASGRAELAELLNLLGLADLEPIPTSYLELLTAAGAVASS